MRHVAHGPRVWYAWRCLHSLGGGPLLPSSKPATSSWGRHGGFDRYSLHITQWEQNSQENFVRSILVSTHLHVFPYTWSFGTTFAQHCYQAIQSYQSSNMRAELKSYRVEALMKTYGVLCCQLPLILPLSGPKTLNSKPKGFLLLNLRVHKGQRAFKS